MLNREGERFGNYRLIRLLGQAGFGAVYLGEHAFPPVSPSPEPPRQFPDRRAGLLKGKVVAFMTLALLIVLGSILLGISMGSPFIAHRQATATTGDKATAAAAFSVYDTAVATHGIMSGFDSQHTGDNPYEKVLSPKQVHGLVQDWVSHLGGAWRNSSPVAANDMIYIGSGDGSFYALDARSGSKLWTFPSKGDAFTSPAVANGVVYVGSEDGSFYALDAHDGHQLWSSSIGISSPPAVANGVVYVGDRAGNLDAFDARSGQQLWTFQTGTGNGIFDPPAIADDVVYLGSFSGQGANGSLYALDAHSGQQLWTFRPALNANITSLAVARGVVYVGSDGDLYALGARDGHQLWDFPIEGNKNNGFSEVTSLAVVNNMVYVGDPVGKLYALDAGSSHQLWAFPKGISFDAPPVVANGVIYFDSDEGSLYALDAQSGRQLWVSPPGSCL